MVLFNISTKKIKEIKVHIVFLVEYRIGEYTMKNLLKSHTLVVIIALCLSTILSYQAIKQNNCFEIQINERTKIKAGYCIYVSNIKQ